MEQHKRLILIVIIGALLIGNVFFGIHYFTLRSELYELRSAEDKRELNGKILRFTAMFIGEVLQADREVDFETRLSLENAVRDLKDEEIMSEWQNFVGSKTEIEAQNSVKRLLAALVGKIQE